MLSPAERKAAVAAYKERKPEPGIFAVYCAATGETWVGHAPNLPAARNRLWLALGQGATVHVSRSLGAAWKAHAPEHFTFEVLERLDPDAPTYLGLPDLRKAAAAWRERLGAEPA